MEETARGRSTIGVRALRSALAETIRRVEAGQTVTITHGVRPVARLAPLDEEAPTLAGLVNAGAVIPHRRTSALRPPAPVPVCAGIRIDQVHRELR